MNGTAYRNTLFCLKRISGAFIFLLLFSSLAHAQRGFELQKNGVQLEAGEAYDRIRTRSAAEFFRFGDELVSVKFSKNYHSVHIQKFSIPNLKELERTKASSPSRRINPEVIYYRSGEEGKLVIFYSWRRKEFLGDDQEFLFHRELDRDSLSLSDTIRTLSIKEGHPLESKTGICGFLCFTGVDKYHFNSSRKDSTLLGTFRLEEDVSKDPSDKAFLRFFILDSEMEIEWVGRGNMPYPQWKVDHSDILIGDDKDLHAIGKIHSLKEIEGGTEKTFSHFEVLKFDPHRDRFNGKKIESGDKTIHSIDIHETPSDRYLCSGTYTASPESDMVKGFFSFYIDRDFDFSDMKHHPIPFELMNAYEEKETVEANKKKGKGHEDVGMRRLTLKDAYSDSSGNIYLIAEESFSRYEPYYTDMNWNYYNKDIVVKKLSPGLEEEWTRILPKSQMSTKEEHDHSYKAFPLGSGICFLYLDREENLKLEPDESPEQIDHGGEVHAYHLGYEEGRLRKMPVLDPGETGYDLGRFGFDRVERIGPETLIIEAKKGGGEELLLRIDFD